MKDSVRTLLVILLGVLIVAAQQPQGKAQGNHFVGTYEELQPAQKKLVEEWYAEYNRVVGDHLSPTDYSELPVSTRTTFEAVTQALLKTSLTDKSGKSLGDALDLVQAIETVSGKVPKARGDLQFRIYVMLTPTALDTLKQSREFYRDVDNTVFHKGYPLNYRQGGGDPSIQISMSKDGRHADIDVDYRSSRFPVALFNGHLTAANSDVRAGDNSQRHDRRWMGLAAWWRGLFGLPDAQEDTLVAQEGTIPPKPRKGAKELGEAVQDFLTAWLTEQKPEIAAAYLAPRSFSCLEEYGPQAGTQLNMGLAPYAAAKDLAAIDKQLGKINRLQDAVTAYPIQDKSYKLAKQQPGAVFSLSQVTNRAATELECDPQKAYDDFDRFRAAGTLDKFGDYYASTFRLRIPNETSDGISLLWLRENKTWKIVSWDIEPEEGKPEPTPDTRPAAPAIASASSAEAGSFQADPALQHAAADFFRTWLIKDNFQEAATYFSPLCHECIKLYLAEGEEPPSSPQDQASYILRNLTVVGKEIGPIHHLTDALEPVPPEHDDLQPISHPDRSAYALVAVPDYLATVFECAKRSAESPYRPASSELPVYGTYYAAVFALRTPGEHPATVSLLWKKVAGQWKIIAYDITN